MILHLEDEVLHRLMKTPMLARSMPSKKGDVGTSGWNCQQIRGGWGVGSCRCSFRPRHDFSLYLFRLAAVRQYRLDDCVRQGFHSLVAGVAGNPFVCKGPLRTGGVGPVTAEQSSVDENAVQLPGRPR